MNGSRVRQLFVGAWAKATSARWYLAIASFFAVVHGLLGWAGGAEHTVLLAGIRLSKASILLGPAYILSTLVFYILVPTLLLAAVGEVLVKRARRAP